MDTARKGMAIILAALFVLTALPTQILFNVEREAFTPRTYERALADQSFYEHLPSVLAISISSSLGAQKLPISTKGLSPEDWERFVSDLLPPPILKQVGDEAVTSTLAYLNNQSDTVAISMKPLKERLSGEPGARAVMNLLRTQPVCTLDEIARITLGVLNRQEISLCNPPEGLYPILLPVIQGQLQVTSAALPDQVNLLHTDPASEQADPRERLQIMRLGMRWGLLVPLFFLVLLTIVAVRSLRDWLGWWGICLFLTGLFSSLAAWLGAPLLGYLLLQAFSLTFGGLLPSVLVESSSQLAAAVAGQLMRPVLLQSLVLLLTGGLMLLLAAAGAGKRAQKSA